MSLAAVGFISWRSTGSLLPSNPNDALLIQNSILLIVLATLLTERYFTKPGDAFINALSALLTVLPLRATAPRLAWSILAGFLLFVIAAALVTITLQAGSRLRVKTPWLMNLQRIGYQVCLALGRARVVYSIVFLTAVVFFIKERGPLETWLLIFWGVYLALWPLGIPELLSRVIRRDPTDDETIGTLLRVDSPDVARVLLTTEARWAGSESPVLVSLADGSHRWGVPLMSENRADGVLGTVLLGHDAPDCSGNVGDVRAAITISGAPSRSEFTKRVSGGKGTNILGLVREGSRSTKLRFELIPSAQLVLGQLTVVPSGLNWAYYQVIDCETAEEPFGTLNYGSQIATAVPVGVLNCDGVFNRAEWIPKINAPVFGVDPGLAVHAKCENDFVLGHIPGTKLDLRGDFVRALESHTAILGATGSGKTELAFDLLKHAAKNDVKVICIDLTSQYAPRLADHNPTHLTISEEQARDLGEKLFDAETGKYGAGDEKKVLHGFALRLRNEVEAGLRGFLVGKDSHLALIELNEISNTKATLWITEMYLSTLLKLAKVDWHHKRSW
ncbi:DUF87 domain-containing protein [Mycobacterium sp. IS-1556]|uniref:helicase HerA domain-containing protein n=1 Tax=Mycobacterium sp. IS-1556 TaxID=1772276 RepID=UPI0012E36A14|nr:DUF87 domain-containing protein [Mycobacterium sp. IS-1556]